MTPAIAITVAFVAAFKDAKTGLIPNWLTLPSLLGAIVWHFFTGGAAAVFLALLGALGSLVIPWALHRSSRGQAIGGGDVKLFAALGGWLGPLHGLEVELSSFLLVGLLAVIQLTFQGHLTRVLLNSVSLLANPVLPVAWRRSVDPSVLTEMRMGPAIAVATLIVVSRHYWFTELPWPV